MTTHAFDGLENHDQIATILDDARGEGLISDYLVSWRGCDSCLTPKVTVWSEARQAAGVRDELGQSLSGLVPTGQIIVVDEVRGIDRLARRTRTARSPLARMQHRPSNRRRRAD